MSVDGQDGGGAESSARGRSSSARPPRKALAEEPAIGCMALMWQSLSNWELSVPVPPFNEEVKKEEEREKEAYAPPPPPLPLPQLRPPSLVICWIISRSSASSSRCNASPSRAASSSFSDCSHVLYPVQDSRAALSPSSEYLHVVYPVQVFRTASSSFSATVPQTDEEQELGGVPLALWLSRLLCQTPSTATVGTPPLPLLLLWLLSLR
mmetsp:Transcript_22985/g.56954  ORF Transcript_22985/g.56954 Transcript_22985/m.56954 type:complete len:209 (+) Transcript_22985:1203-1829(+)